MREYSKKLTSIYQTGAEMLRLATVYNDDVAHFDGYSLPAFYGYVKQLPYRPDPVKIEFISRPAATLRTRGVKYRDCDDKAVCFAAWLHRRKIPFRFVGVSTRADKKLHHVLIEAIVKGENKIIDPTYPHNDLFIEGKYTEFKPLTKFTVYNG